MHLLHPCLGKGGAARGLAPLFKGRLDFTDFAVCMARVQAENSRQVN